MASLLITVVAFVVAAFLVVAVYSVLPDESLILKQSGTTLPDTKDVHRYTVGDEQKNIARTPINKVDDYEFSRIFGYEHKGRMEVPQQNFNVILNQRQFDWPDKPLSSDERRDKYRGLREGFTAAGDLKDIIMSEPGASDLVKEAVQRYGENKQSDPTECSASAHENKEIATLVAKAYASDPNYEPIVTKVGANQWEVNELRPRLSADRVAYVEDRIMDTSNDATDIQFEYREKRTVNDAIDPYFPTGDLPYEMANQTDPYHGPVPGMQRMFGPTFDRAKWY